MKNFLIKLFTILTIVFLGSGCTNENEMYIEDKDSKTEISFEVNLLGSPNEETKNSTSELGKCASREELQVLANSGNLDLNVTIGSSTYTKKIIWNETKFITDPILLPQGTYNIKAATITNKSNEIIFSAVNSGSIYADYVPELLPKSFTIGTAAGNIPPYQKTTIDLYLPCALNETAQNFGYVKWNIHFTKLYSIPFRVSSCKYSNEPIYAVAGTLNIINGKYENNIFTPATGNETPVKWAKINTTVNFTNSSNIYSELLFADNYEISNESEWYQFTMKITAPITKTVIGYANVATLINYNKTNINNAWDVAKNAIHFDFCSCKTWFFICDPVVEDPCSSAISSLDVRFNTLNDAASAGLESYIVTQWNSDQTAPISGSWVKGIPAANATLQTQGFTPNKNLYQIRTPFIKFENNSRIGILTKLSDASKPIIKLIDKNGKEYIGKNISEGIYLNLQKFQGNSSTDVPPADCYRVVITLNNVWMDDFRVQPSCPPINSFSESFKYANLQETQQYCGKWYTLVDYPYGSEVGFAPGLWPNNISLYYEALNLKDGYTPSTAITTGLCYISTTQTISLDVWTDILQKNKLVDIRLYNEDRVSIGHARTVVNSSVRTTNFQLSHFGITTSGNYYVKISVAYEAVNRGPIYIDNIQIK